MTRRSLTCTLLTLTLLNLPPSFALPVPIPQVTQGLPGMNQPLAPGFHPGQALPMLRLPVPVPGVRKIEVLSNGFIEVAHILMVLPAASQRDRVALSLAQRAVAEVFTSRPSLSEVDVSVYASGRYAGFGGPPPLLTASVPVARLRDFARVTVSTVATYDRVWLASASSVVPIAPAEAYEGPETTPTYVGTAGQTWFQRLLQRLSSFRGSRADEQVFYQGRPTSRQMAMTFDDGVHPLYEPLILDSLRRAGAKATFFIVGRNALAYPYFVRDIVAQGHEVANHTYHHLRLPALSTSAIRAELTTTDTLLTALTGQDIRFFRPPGGRFSEKVVAVASSEGLTTAMWTDDPGDFNNIGPGKVENGLLSHLRPGGIVLLHENVPDTIRTMTDFVNDARVSGYRLVTLSELAGSR